MNTKEDLQSILCTLDVKLNAKNLKEDKICAPMLINLLNYRQNYHQNCVNSYDSKIISLCYKLENFNSISQFLSLKFFDIKNEIVNLQKLIKKHIDISDLKVPLQHLCTPINIYMSTVSYKEKLIILYKEIWRLEIITKNLPLTYVISEYFSYNLFTEEIGNIFCIIIMKFLDDSLLPLASICQILLCLKHGFMYLNKLITNIPSITMSAVKTILLYDSHNNKFVYEQKIKLLYQLALSKPKMGMEILNLCSNQRTMPELILKLWVNIISSESHNNHYKLIKANTFLSCILDYPHIGKRKNWLFSFIKMQIKDEITPHLIFQIFKNQIMNLMNKIVDEEHLNIVQSNMLMPLSLLLKMYLILKTNLTDKFVESEVETIINTLILKPEIDVFGINFITHSLSLIIYCPILTNNFDHDEKLIDWLNWVVKQIKMAHHKFSFNESVLQLFLHLNNQSHFVNDFVSTNLGMNISLRPHSYSKIKQLINAVSTDTLYRDYLSTLNITNKLNANTTGFLPVSSVINVLKTNKHASQGTIIKSWLIKQILNADTPLHKTLIKVIEEYAQNVLSLGRSNDSFGNLINVDDMIPLNACHQHDQTNNLIPQLLYIYYILYLEDLLINPKSPYYFPSVATELNLLGALNKVPIKAVLGEAIKNHFDYSPLPATLVFYLVKNHPYLCIVEDWIHYNAEPAQDCAFLYGYDRTSIKRMIALNVEKNNIEWVKVMAPSMGDLTCLHDITCLLKLIQKQPEDYLAYPWVMKMFRKYWFHVNAMGLSFDLIADTVQSLAQVPSPTTNYNEIVMMLALDPLVCVKLKSHSFSNPELMAITLRMIVFSLLLSAVYYTKFCTKSHSSTLIPYNTGNNGARSNDRDREEMVANMILLQESALIQILLEILISKNSVGNQLEIMFAQREIRSLICSYLHQKFIDDPKIGRLVHFQGYPLSIIKIIASSVPSAHVFMDLVGDLVLRDPKMETKIFGIHLASHLSTYYTMPKFVDSCRLCLKIMFTMMSPSSTSLITSTQRLQFFCCVTSSMYTICQACPTLIEECVRILINLGQSFYFHSEMSSAPKRPRLTAKLYFGHKDKVAFINYFGQQIDYINEFMKDSPRWEELKGENLIYNDDGKRILREIIVHTFNRIIQDFCIL